MYSLSLPATFALPVVSHSLSSASALATTMARFLPDSMSRSLPESPHAMVFPVLKPSLRRTNLQVTPTEHARLLHSGILKLHYNRVLYSASRLFKKGELWRGVRAQDTERLGSGNSLESGQLARPH